MRVSIVALYALLCLGATTVSQTRPAVPLVWKPYAADLQGDGWRLERKEGSGPWAVLTPRLLPMHITSYTDTEVKEGSSYCWRVAVIMGNFVEYAVTAHDNQKNEVCMTLPITIPTPEGLRIAE